MASGKHGTVRGKIAPIEKDRHARQLPVARRRILAREFGGTAAAALYLPALQAGRHMPACQATGFAETKRREDGNAQWPHARLASESPQGASFRNMPDRGGTKIAVRGCIWCRADPNGVHYEDNGAHRACSGGMFMLVEPTRLGQ
jgi:hypothetical protein